MSEKPDFAGLRAMYVNCSLSRSPERSHTQMLMDRSTAVMRAHGVEIDVLRAVDWAIPHGVSQDMTGAGYDRDDWPQIQQRVLAADILVLGTPIWLGEKSSVCTKVIERLYGYSAELNDADQYVYCGRVGGCLVTGNEDGVKHCATSVLYALQHLGYTIPPQADAGWIGEVGPGPSYGDDGAGLDSDFTNRSTTFMTVNLMHLAGALKTAGGVPAYGNQPSAWDAGERFGYPSAREVLAGSSPFDAVNSPDPAFDLQGG